MAVAHTDVTGERGSILSALQNMMVRMMENHPLARRIEWLNAISDEDLAARGLTRQDAVRQIFQDRYYF